MSAVASRTTSLDIAFEHGIKHASIDSASESAEHAVPLVVLVSYLP
jgi:hypothetical protein